MAFLFQAQTYQKPPAMQKRKMLVLDSVIVKPSDAQLRVQVEVRMSDMFESEVSKAGIPFGSKAFKSIVEVMEGAEISVKLPSKGVDFAALRDLFLKYCPALLCEKEGESISLRRKPSDANSYFITLFRSKAMAPAGKSRSLSLPPERIALNGVMNSLMWGAEPDPIHVLVAKSFLILEALKQVDAERRAGPHSRRMEDERRENEKRLRARQNAPQMPRDIGLHAEFARAMSARFESIRFKSPEIMLFGPDENRLYPFKYLTSKASPSAMRKWDEESSLALFKFIAKNAVSEKELLASGPQGALSAKPMYDLASMLEHVPSPSVPLAKLLDSEEPPSAMEREFQKKALELYRSMGLPRRGVTFSCFRSAMREYLSGVERGDIERGLFTFFDLNLRRDQHRIFTVDFEQKKLVYAGYAAQGKGSGSGMYVDKADLYAKNTTPFGTFRLEPHSGERYGPSNSYGLAPLSPDVDAGRFASKGVIFHGAKYVPPSDSTDGLAGRSNGCISLNKAEFAALKRIIPYGAGIYLHFDGGITDKRPFVPTKQQLASL